MSRAYRRSNRPTPPRAESLEVRQLLAAFVVSNTDDSGAGSLRQAILDANADAGAIAKAGISAGFPSETINFDIPGSGVQTIAPATALPAINFPTTIDATMQPGYAGTPLVVLDGVNATSSDGTRVDGLNFDTGAYINGGAKGLEIVRFGGSGIVSNGIGGMFEQLAIGSDATGQPDLGNGGYGIEFASYNGYSTIIDSLIAHNGLKGAGSPYDFLNDPRADTENTFINVTQFDNETKATSLTVSTPTGTYDDYNVAYGSTQTLTYTVTNTGSHPATNVIPTIHEGPETNFATIQSVTTSQGMVIWNQNPAIANTELVNFGTIAPGASATVTVVVQVLAQSSGTGNDGAILNVTANSPEVDYNPGSTQGLYTLSIPGSDNGTPATGTGIGIPTTGIGIGIGTSVPVTVPVGSLPTDSGTFPTVPANLTVTAGPVSTAPQVGQPSSLTFTIANNFTGTAYNAVATIDLSGLPAGSTRSVYIVGSPQAGTTSGTPIENNYPIPANLMPVAGQPGVYQVALGSLAPGATDSIVVSVTPGAGRALVVLVAATDSNPAAMDPNPVRNVALLAVPLAAAPATATVTAAGTVQVDFSTVLPRAQAQKLSHYQLLTAAGATVRIRSARYNAQNHRVTLRLAHPLPAGAALARLNITGLGDAANVAVSDARKPKSHRR